MWSPHHWSVWVRCPPIGHTQTTQCVRYDQWHWAAAVLVFRWNFLCICCSITDWQHRSDRCSVAIYTESDESSWHATATISKVCLNIIHLIYDHKHMPFRFSGKYFVGNFHFSKMSHVQQKFILLKFGLTFSFLLLISPTYPQYLPQHHKSQSHKAPYNSLHPPVNFSISPHNISLSTTNLIPLKPFIILSTLPLTSLSHPTISPSAPQISFP